MLDKLDTLVRPLKRQARHASNYIKEEKVQGPQKPQNFFNYSVRREREREIERENDT